MVGLYVQEFFEAILFSNPTGVHLRDGAIALEFTSYLRFSRRCRPQSPHQLLINPAAVRNLPIAPFIPLRVSQEDADGSAFVISSSPQSVSSVGTDSMEDRISTRPLAYFCLQGVQPGFLSRSMSVKAVRQPVICAVVEDHYRREEVVAFLLHDLEVLVEDLAVGPDLEHDPPAVHHRRMVDELAAPAGRRFQARRPGRPIRSPG